MGKTTLARLTADAFDADFIALSAVFFGVKDIREAMQKAELTLAQHGRRTLLFVDVVHRFNKAQQDAFLPYVENQRKGSEPFSFSQKAQKTLSSSAYRWQSPPQSIGQNLFPGSEIMPAIEFNIPH